jgi:hypothetical protein
MSSVRCTVTLLADKNRKVDIEIRKENNGSQLWKLIKAAGGNLSLPKTTGVWEVIPGDTLALWEDGSRKPVQEGIMLVVFDINKVFMHDIVNDGKTIVANDAGLYNGNPTEKDVSCKLARMY